MDALQRHLWALTMALQSAIVSVRPQIDGRRQVEEIHTADDGTQTPWFWMAGADDDLDAALALHAAQVAEQNAGET